MRPEHDSSYKNNFSDNKGQELSNSQIDDTKLTGCLRTIRDEWRFINKYFATTFSRYSRDLEKEGDELMKQLYSIQCRNITDSEDIKEIRQKASNWRKKVVDFWLG